MGRITGFVSRGLAVAVLMIAACSIALPAYADEASGEWAPAATFHVLSFEVMADLEPDYSWYDPASSNLVIGEGVSQLELVGLANIVNGTAPGIAQDGFSGKTITLIDSADFLGAEWAPIGTAEHPFEGTFDGGASEGCEISGYTITQTHANAGFFGVTAPGSILRNVSVGASAEGEGITIGTHELDGDGDEVGAPYTGGLIQCVGSLVGRADGSIVNCSSSMDVSIANNSEVTAIRPVICDSIGGLAGRCRGGISGCSYDGSLDLYSASDTENTDDQGYLIMTCIGGVVGFFGDIDAPGSTTTSIDHCVNAGDLRIVTAGYQISGDRFGTEVVTQAGYVGGIAGYTTGSILDSENSGSLDTSYLMSTYINTNGQGYTNLGAAGSYIGGIVGGLRCDILPEMTGTPEGVLDAGAGCEDNPVYVRRCVNTGLVFGHHGVGGVVGSAGWYSIITECVCNIPKGNSVPTDPDYMTSSGGVKGARWNKPMVGGIVGKTYGDISYCYNHSRTMSTTNAGYYVAGIAGVVFRGTSTEGYSAPAPEMWGCYNTGYAQSSLRAASLVGQNEGFIHDCYALKETSYHTSDGVEQLVASQYATMTRVEFIDDASDLKKSETVAKLNYMAANEGWEASYVTAPSNQVNHGYPIFAWQEESGERVDLSDSSLAVTATLADDADYTGKPAVPRLSVQLDGKTLYQDSDFRVIVADDAINCTLASDRMTGTRPYTATIEGIGHYSGTPANISVPYGIVVGDIASCTIVTPEHKYTGEPVSLLASEIMLYTKAGTVVGDDEYTFVVNPKRLKDASGNYLKDKDGNYVYETQDGHIVEYDCINRGGYEVVIKATSGADTNFIGTKSEPAFVISPADINGDCTLGAVSFGDTSYSPTQTPGGQGNITGVMEFAYTGSEIKPSLSGITYNGMSLRAGTSATDVNGDYYLQHLAGTINDENGIVLEEGDFISARDDITYDMNIQACWPDTIGNYANYLDLFYRIVPADIATADIMVPDQAYTGQPRGVASITFNGMTLEQGIDYEVEFANNTAVGQATATITGMGNFKGSTVRTFQIMDAEPIELTDDNTTVEMVERMPWTGRPLRPSVAVTYDGAQLHSGIDYLVDYTDNVDKGTATVTITGCGVYAGTLAKTFEIVAHSISAEPTFGKITGSSGTKYCTVDVNDGVGLVSHTSNKWGGSSEIPLVDLVGLGDEVKLSIYRSYAYNKEMNLTGLTIVGKTSGESIALDSLEVKADKIDGGANHLICTFTMPDEDVVLQSLSYVDASKDLASCTIEPIGSKTYTGSALTPAPTVKLGEKTLVKDTDYTVKYSNNVNAGTATVTIAGTGEYTGTAKTTFKITARSVTPTVTLSSTAYTYDAKVKTPGVTVKAKVGTITRTLKKGTDYTVTYASGRKSVGTYKVTAKLKGNYSGSKSVTFKINPKGTSLKTLTGLSGSATVRWAKQSGKMSTSYITGYQVQVATNAKFTTGKKTVTVKGYGKTSAKVTKLKGNKKYYVHIRTYKKVGSVTYYSPWSKVKTVKTKAVAKRA